MKKHIVASLFFNLITTQAQQSQFIANSREYQNNLSQELYNTKVYGAAIQKYSTKDFKTLFEAEENLFYEQLLSIILNKESSDVGYKSFQKTYPNSAYHSLARLPIAENLLAKKDFENALKILKKIDKKNLSSEEKTDFVLKLGYAKFMSGDRRGAIANLEEVYSNGDTTNINEVSYMLGHLYYIENNYPKAFQFFEPLKTIEKFKKLVQPYFVQMYYNEQKYDQAILAGNELLNENISDSYKSEVHKIIGESEFKKANYKNAYPHLKSFLASKSNPSESDLYQMGFVSAHLGKYDEAVSYYNQLINSQSKLAQNTYYQLGNAYLNTQKKQEALSAFRSAKQMNYDAKVKELAHEQYAKLSYDIGNPFETSAVVIQEFIRNYPNNLVIPEMKRLLVKSYLFSGNYKETLAAIDNIRNPYKEIDQINQEVSYLLGSEEFNKGNLENAQKYFERSLQFNLNKSFEYSARYWLAQTYYLQGNYPDAISQFSNLLKVDFFNEKQQLSYDLGYAYFKSKNFKKAEEFFYEYLKNPKIEFKEDAELRLADSYFANNKLNEALAIYDKATSEKDYTLFQKAIALGFQGKINEKINALKNLISKFPQSEYTDEALYDLGVIYSTKGNYSLANEYFTKIINEDKDKKLVADAEVYRLQNYIDENQESKIKSELEKLALKYKNSEKAFLILQTSKSYFTKISDTEGYKNLANILGIKIDNNEINEINLNTAQQYFSQKKYEKAIPFLQKYLNENPNGAEAFLVKYQLSECYFQLKDLEKSKSIFEELANLQNEYKEESATRLVQILIINNNWSEAKVYLEDLKNSTNPNIRNFAELELMNGFAKQNNYSQAEKYAELVLQNSKNAPSVMESAKVILARSLMYKGKNSEAEKAYSDLEKSKNSTVAAEALYAKAFYQNAAKKYKNSNETIFKLANNYAAEEYWGAKALVVMAKNYLALKDKYQASYTVDQIILNYQHFPDVVSQAQEVKNMIK